ncbi:MAG: J domain-containing protein [Opitutales bacterium]|nr:J domain-containing protein [Opitutales bacterium]
MACEGEEKFVNVRERDFIDYYAVLEISPSASSEEIRKAWQNLQRIYHPDKNIGAQNQEEIADYSALINEAFQILSDSRSRKEYDNRLKRIAVPAEPAQAVPAKSRGNARSVLAKLFFILFAYRPHCFLTRFLLAEFSLLLALSAFALLSAAGAFEYSAWQVAGTLALVLTALLFSGWRFGENPYPFLLAGVFSVSLVCVWHFLEPLREGLADFQNPACVLVFLATWLLSLFACRHRILPAVGLQAAAILFALGSWRSAQIFLPTLEVKMLLLTFVGAVLLFVALLLSFFKSFSDEA